MPYANEVQHKLKTLYSQRAEIDKEIALYEKYLTDREQRDTAIKKALNGDIESYMDLFRQKENAK